MRSQIDRNSAELLAAIRAVFAAAPWAALEIMFVLTPEQWQALLSGEALTVLLCGKAYGDVLASSTRADIDGLSVI